MKFQISNLQLSMLSLLVAFIAVWFIMPRVIPLLKQLKFGQEIRELGPKSHYKKAGTPTMGGIVIIIGILIGVFVIAVYTMEIDWYLVSIMFVYGLIGLIDDYIKIKQKHNEGLTVIQKLLLQIVTALIFTLWAYFSRRLGSQLFVPFFGLVDFGFWYLPLTFIAIISITNAVNLSDGLDGLCAGISSIVMIFFLVVSVALPESYTCTFAGAFIGANLGFLRYNSNPAEIFMGDTGSMALGGALAGIAIRTHMEIYFLICGFLFVLEALSVLIQVGYFKATKGKRFFRMAPIHHHFELGGWKETRVVSVFYTWAAISVAIAFILL